MKKQFTFILIFMISLIISTSGQGFDGFTIENVNLESISIDAAPIMNNFTVVTSFQFDENLSYIFNPVEPGGAFIIKYPIIESEGFDMMIYETIGDLDFIDNNTSFIFTEFQL